LREYSKEEIERLIGMPKQIVEAPKKKWRSESGSRRNDMTLRSEDGGLEFAVFMRINEKFAENFSIGLEYLPKDEPGRFCLLRCNGPHGLFIGGPDLPSHFLYHVHKAKPENIKEGRRPEWGGEAVKDYASFEEALGYFLKRINAANADEHFPDSSQLCLPLSKEEQ
jgi:hypothetical protein